MLFEVFVKTKLIIVDVADTLDSMSVELVLCTIRRF